MDLFAAFPALRSLEHSAITGRALRLIVLAALPYDGEGYYFALSEPRYWLRRAEGTSIGVGGLQVRPDARPPFRTIARHLRRAWRVKVDLPPLPWLYLLWPEDAEAVATATLPDRLGLPHLLLLTPPRLGGEPLPDALVQAAYFVRLRRPPVPNRPLLYVRHEALPTFLSATRPWPLATLQQLPWAELRGAVSLPPDGLLRPVLVLRALQRLHHAGLFPPDTEL